MVKGQIKVTPRRWTVTPPTKAPIKFQLPTQYFRYSPHNILRVEVSTARSPVWPIRGPWGGGGGGKSGGPFIIPAYIFLLPPNTFNISERKVIRNKRQNTKSVILLPQFDP